MSSVGERLDICSDVSAVSTGGARRLDAAGLFVVPESLWVHSNDSGCGGHREAVIGRKVSMLKFHEVDLNIVCKVKSTQFRRVGVKFLILRNFAEDAIIWL